MTQSTKKQRNLLLALLFLGWSMGNFDRYVINYAIVVMGQDLHLTSTETGFVLSSFFLGYAIMQIPGGLLADRFNPRWIMMATILALSLFTSLTAAAGSLAALLAVRFLFGLGEGSYFPTASKFITVSFPERERSKALAVVLSSGGIMAIFTALAAGLLLESLGWRLMFTGAGVAGLVLTAVYFFKLKLISASPEAEAAVGAAPASGGSKTAYRQLLKTPMLWKLFAAYFMLYFVNWGLSTWMPTYLSTVRGLNMVSIGVLSVIPGLAAIIGFYISGFIQDKLNIQTSKWLAVACVALMAVMLFAMYASTSVSLFFVYQTFVTLLLTFVFVLLPSIALKKSNPEDVGFVSGFVNTGGQLAGFVAPTAIGLFLDWFNGSYFTVFLLLVLCALLGTAALGSMSFKAPPLSIAGADPVIPEAEPTIT